MSLFKIYRADGHFVIKLGNIKIRFKNPLINRLRDCCCIVNPDYFLKQGTTFIHPIGIVIHKNVKIGKNCYIYQNVTIGGPKPNEHGEYHAPQIGDNVVIFANSCIIGNVIIGNNSIIGAGAVVVKDVPPNSVVAGNPAKVIKTCIEDSL